MSEDAHVSLDDVIETWDRLLTLLEDWLPVRVRKADVDRSVWGIVAAALTMKVATTGRAALVLARQGLLLDVESLLRSQYESVTTLSWLAIRPSQNLRRWLRVSEERELEELKKRLALELVEPGTRIDSFRDLARDHTRRAPSVFAMARDADSYWTGQLDPFFVEPWCLSLAYPAVYMGGSRAVHTNVKRLIEAFMTVDAKAGDWRVSWEDPLTGNPPKVMFAVVFLAMSLAVTARSIGWPPEEEVMKFASTGFTLRG